MAATSQNAPSKRPSLLKVSEQQNYAKIIVLKEGQAAVWEMSGEDDAAKRPQ